MMPAQKKRHGCLTTWLILIILGAVASTIIVLVGAAAVGLSTWVIIVEIVVCVIEIVCAIALFGWKKWGFYGFCVAAVIMIILNIIAKSWFSVASPIISIALLYAVLQIGKDNKGWPQLS
jgi:hypothetical protein